MAIFFKLKITELTPITGRLKKISFTYMYTKRIFVERKKIHKFGSKCCLITTFSFSVYNIMHKLTQIITIPLYVPLNRHRGFRCNVRQIAQLKTPHYYIKNARTSVQVSSPLHKRTDFWDHSEMGTPLW